MKWAPKFKEGCTNADASPVVVGELCKTEAESSEPMQIAMSDQGNHEEVPSQVDREALDTSSNELQEEECKQQPEHAVNESRCKQQPDHMVADGWKTANEFDIGANSDFLPSETLIIFDWDDTIMPTSWIQSNKLCNRHSPVERTPSQTAALESIANQAIKLLEAAVNLGEVVIITSAENGWIEYSCELFLPNLMTALETVRFVSARSLYESFCNKDASTSRDWKIQAFQAEAIRKFDQEGRRNILSIGDSPDEFAALEHVRQFWATRRGSYAKSVQLLLKPTAMQLQQQLVVLTQQVNNLVQYKDNLTLHIGDDSKAPPEMPEVEKKPVATSCRGGIRI
jgi:hypothetical protein